MSRFHCTYYALYFSLVVQFSMISCLRSRGDLLIIPPSFAFVKTFSKTFLKVFSRLNSRSLRQPLPSTSRTACILYYSLLFLSSTFYIFFAIFLSFVRSNSLNRHNVRHSIQKVNILPKKLVLFTKYQNCFL